MSRNFCVGKAEAKQTIAFCQVAFFVRLCYDGKNANDPARLGQEAGDLMAKKEKKSKKEKKEKAPKGGKKDKKEKKRKKGRKGKGGVDEEVEEKEKSPEENWLYYSEGPLSFLTVVLIILCVLDAVLAIYAIVYTKHVERDNIVAIEAAKLPVERAQKGEIWFTQPDGTILREDGSTSTQPALPAQPQESAPAVPGAEGEGEPPAEGEEQAQAGEEPAQADGQDAEAPPQESAQQGGEPAQSP